MKTNYLLFIGAILLLLTGCAGENLDAFAPHFHAEATRAGEKVTAKIKVPGRIGETKVYLSDIKPIKEIRTTPKNRKELVFAEFIFSKNQADELKSADGKHYSWDAKCDVLTINGDASNIISHASILVTMPEGINKKYENSEKHKTFDAECYEGFNSAKVSNPMPVQYATILFHPGHPTLDPEFGKDGIPIQGGD